MYINDCTCNTHIKGFLCLLLFLGLITHYCESWYYLILVYSLCWIYPHSKTVSAMCVAYLYVDTRTCKIAAISWHYFCIISSENKLTINILIRFCINISDCLCSWIREGILFNFLPSEIKPNLSRYGASIPFVPVDPIIKIIEYCKWVSSICHKDCLKCISLEININLCIKTCLTM